MKKNLLVLAVLIASTLSSIAQDTEGSSNILEYTPSQLLKKGQFDVKVFNNLYTQDKAVADSGKIVDNLPRQFFYTTTVEFTYGISESRRINVGFATNLKSNVINADSTDFGYGEVFKFQNGTYSRAALSTFAPVIKITPFKNIGNFSFQTGLVIPLFDEDNTETVFLDKKSLTWDTRFFFDKTFGGKYQIFTELDFMYHFGDEAPEGNQTGGFYANNSLATPASVFFSYFPGTKYTIYAMAQHYQLWSLTNTFEQNFTQTGLGAKWQATPKLNFEILYTNFLRGSDFTGLGETFNLGLRYIH